MTAKEIGRLAGRIFQHIIPPNWAARSQEDQEDYGVDYELELTDEGDHATGQIFKIQQKGSEAAILNAAGTFVSFSEIPVPRVRYYLTQLQVPIIFVVVDVRTKKIYWVKMQGNAEVSKALTDAEAAKQKTMTLHLPAENLLPATFDRLLQAVRESGSWLVMQGIKAATSTELLDAALRAADFTASAQAVARQHDIFRSGQIEQELQAKRYESAFQRSEVLFQSASESVEMRFAAALNLLRINPVLLRVREQEDREKALTLSRLDVTAKLFKITLAKNSDRRLRLFAAFLLRAARLHELAQRDFGFYLSRKAQEGTGAAFTISMTDVARAPIAQAVVSQFHRLQRLFAWLIRRGAFHLTAPAWNRMASDLTPFLARLDNEDLHDAAASLRKWLEEAGTIAVEIATKTENWSDVLFCALGLISLATPIDSDVALDAQFAKSRTIIEKVPDRQFREKGLADLAKFREEFRQAKPNLRDDAEMYRQMANALDVDLSDEDDQTAQVVKIGIRDLNPERVLKYCKSLFVKSGSFGVPGQMLGLPTAGFKTLRCTKFGYEIGGLELDGLFSDMRELHCDTCTSRDAHPPDWKWTRQWQSEQHAIHGQASRPDQ
jgi:hypothetical protein